MNLKYGPSSEPVHKFFEEFVLKSRAIPYRQPPEVDYSYVIQKRHLQGYLSQKKHPPPRTLQ